MRRYGIGFWAGLAVGGCGIDAGLLGKDADEPGAGDSGAGDAGAGDSGAGDSGAGDSGAGDACGDRAFPGGDIPIVAECTPDPEDRWTLVRRWSAPVEGGSAVAVVAGPLTDDDGDGHVGEGDRPALLVPDGVGRLTAYDAADGAVRWTADATGLHDSTPAIVDVDGDGSPEVVAISAGVARAYRGGDGAPVWASTGWASVVPAWQCGAVAVGDLDGDGAPEAAWGRWVFDAATGAVVGEGAYGYGQAHSCAGPVPAVADLDLDGVAELLVGDAAYGRDGRARFATGGVDGAVAVGDFDADPEGELVGAGTKGADGQVWVLDHDGHERWRVTVRERVPGPPAVADLDGDGSLEIVVGWDDGIVAYDGDGATRWEAGARPNTYWHGVSAADLDGDGAWEVLVTVDDGLHVLDGADGSELAAWPLAGGFELCSGPPAVLDVDGDGSAEIAFVDVTASGAEVVVVSSATRFGAARPGWNAHAYDPAAMDDAGGVRSPAPPPGDGGGFRAAGPSDPPDDVAPDVIVEVVDVCSDACADGALVVWVAVGNEGDGPLVEDLPVALTTRTDAGDVTLGSTTWTEDLPPGRRGAAVRVDLAGVALPLADLRAAVGPAAGECDPDDDVATWGAVTCP